MECLGFSLDSIMPSTNNGSFTSFFPVWMPYMSFSSLIAVGRASSTMLNTSGDKEHLYFFLILEERMAFSFSPLSILAVCLSYKAMIILRYVSSILTLLNIFLFYISYIYLYVYV